VTAGGASQSGRYRPIRKRRASTAMIGLLAAVVAAVLLVVLGARAVVAHPSACPQEAVAQVAVSGEIAPAVQRMAGLFNRQHRLVAGHCAQVAVRAATPASIAGQLANPPPLGPQAQVDAWIPDSQLWIDLARSTPAGRCSPEATC
jgi:Bacterial extracellular solute-binding protein